MCFLKVDVGSEAGTLVGDCVFGVGDEGALEGFGACSRAFVQLERISTERLSTHLGC